MKVLRCIFVFLLVLPLSVVCGCSKRAFLEPRSEVLSNAESEGIALRTIDEDRTRFYEQERAHEERLLALVEQRSGSEFRDRSYRIGPDDVLQLHVFDVPELNLTERVGHTGMLPLPLIGAVHAVGKTEAELQQELVRRLSTYVRNPQVSIAVAEYASQRVAVMGAVKQPGRFALKRGGQSLLELLSEAGGVTEKAGNYVNFIPAELSGVSVKADPAARARLALDSYRNLSSGNGIEVYLDQVLGTRGGIPLEVPVRGGDMIIVPEAGKVTVEGEVEKAGSFDLAQQMTLLGALAASGGITYAAKVDEIEVVRGSDLQDKIHLVVDLERVARGEERDPRLRNGDIIRVPSHSGRRVTQDTYEAITRIINFGVGSNYNIQ